MNKSVVSAVIIFLGVMLILNSIALNYKDKIIDSNSGRISNLESDNWSQWERIKDLERDLKESNNMALIQCNEYVDIVLSDLNATLPGAPKSRAYSGAINPNDMICFFNSVPVSYGKLRDMIQLAEKENRNKYISKNLQDKFNYKIEALSSDSFGDKWKYLTTKSGTYLTAQFGILNDNQKYTLKCSLKNKWTVDDGINNECVITDNNWKDIDMINWINRFDLIADINAEISALNAEVDRSRVSNSNAGLLSNGDVYLLDKKD